MVLVLCMLTCLSGTVMADGLRTSNYAKADSCAEMQFLFEGFEQSVSLTNGDVTTAMVLSALGRYFQVGTYMGNGTGAVYSDNTPLLETPNSNSETIRQLSPKMTLTATSVQDGWYCVSVDGATGYLPVSQADIRCDSYPDLSYGAWYAPYMIWAVETGILETMDAEKTLTRSQLATLLVDTAAKLGCTLPEINPAYSFADAASFTNGLDAATKLQMAGIILEKEDGSFGPEESVSISEAQGILLRYLPNLNAAFQSRLVPVSTVPAGAPVEDSWFDDACFIGHSQVVGMNKYFNLPNADYYAVIGHTAQEALDFPYYPLPNGGDGSLRKALEQAQYGKVYIMLGINDCTNKDDQLEKFLAPMKQIIELVRETQPDAQIYLLSLAPVGRETPNNICYSIDNVLLFTQAVKSLAREYNTEYLDVFRLMSDEYGYILNEYNAGDGIHIDAHHYAQILDYLKCHTLQN